jgi:hypothetical protein
MRRGLNNPVIGRTYLGSRLVCMLHDSMGGVVITEDGPTVPLTIPIMDWLRSQTGYCIDAPEKMPGGSCYSDVLDCPKGRFESLHQTEVER